MKIAVMIPTFTSAYGIEKVAAEQAEDLARRGNEVTIFALRGGLEPPPGVRLEVLGMPRSLLAEKIYCLIFPLDVFKVVKWVLRLKNYDVIYSHQYPMNWLACLAKKRYGTRYVYYQHHINPPEAFPTLIERTYMRLKAYPEKWTIRRADAAISISQFSRRQLRKEAGIDSEVVYNRIDTSRFHPGIDGTAIRKRHNLGNAPVALFCGRMVPTKGIHLLIESFYRAREKVPGARLLLVGKHFFKDYSARLKQMSDTSVVYAGEVPEEEVPLYYAASDVCATASLAEGFNLFLAEAQACGKPVVAFNIGPHPEVVRDTGTGILVPARDTAAMADAIAAFLTKVPAAAGGAG